MKRNEFDELLKHEQLNLTRALTARGIVVFPDGLPELLAESRERIAGAVESAFDYDPLERGTSPIEETKTERYLRKRYKRYKKVGK